MVAYSRSKRTFGASYASRFSTPGNHPNEQRYLAKLPTHWKVHKSFPSLADLAELLGMSVAAGDILVAAIDGRPTVKYLRKALDGPYDQEAANADYESI